MSELRRFSVVCEGPADYYLIEATIAAILGGADFILQRIQPPDSLYGGDAGPHGGGWKGVRSWCQKTCQQWGDIAASRTAIAGDLLIIHVDADIADDAEINCAQPCPPAEATVERLRTVILGWLGSIALPNWVILCTPSKDMDAWVLTALYPQDEWSSAEIECRPSPADHLRNKPEKLVRQRDGKNHKCSASYQEIGTRMIEAWPRVIEVCRQADRFQSDFLVAITRELPSVATAESPGKVA